MQKEGEKLVIVKSDGQTDLSSRQEKNKVLETQLANRQEVINEKNTQLRKLKTKMVIGGGLGTIAIIGLILMSIGIIQ